MTLNDIFKGIDSARIAIIGDFCLDAYWTADMTLSEISREVPHFPLPIIDERMSPGGAGNVCVATYNSDGRMLSATFAETAASRAVIPLTAEQLGAETIVRGFILPDVWFSSAP